jgi:tRNA-dihydrouridine synthase A
MPSKTPFKFAVAPMLDWTDRHYRYMARLMSKHTLLYTEMVTTGAILFGKGDYLTYNDEEHPVALQLGGSDPKALAQCAKIATERGYDQINLNVGCPSDRVQNGRFGACLMAEPQLVADCVQAMREATHLPVTVKTRLGIDDQDSYAFLQALVETGTDAGCDTWIIHARKAWLQGLSPKQNREIPPLNYDRVYQLKADYPDLDISINGGIKDFDAIHGHLRHLDGVMVGRQAYQTPMLLAEVDQQLYGCTQKPLTPFDVVEHMMPYIEQHLKQGGRLNHITKPMIGLFQGLPKGRAWRRHISDFACQPGAGLEVVKDALAIVETAAAQAACEAERETGL